MGVKRIGRRFRALSKGRRERSGAALFPAPWNQHTLGFVLHPGPFMLVNGGLSSADGRFYEVKVSYIELANAL